MSIKIDPRIESCVLRIQDSGPDKFLEACQDMQTTLDLAVAEAVAKEREKVRSLADGWECSVKTHYSHSREKQVKEDLSKELRSAFGLDEKGER